ncbi:MAG TPA: methyltransferase domain-containing protein [Burkholderiales bacterium]|nr:methyltransferase domain-containing protein [Burkholderiales bacterium]
MRHSIVKYAVRVMLVWGAVAGLAAAQDKSVAPGINDRFLEGQNYGEFVDQFEREGREIYDRRHEIVKAVGLKPGMAVADLGAGSGLFTYLFANEVGPGGKVYAVDINTVMVSNIVRRSREQGYQHVEGRVGAAKSVPLPPASVDVVFTSDVYHHFEYPQIMLQGIRAALKPGGTFVIVDFERVEGVSRPRVLEHVRAGKETVIKEVQAEGFRLLGERKLLQDNYFITFQKQ